MAAVMTTHKPQQTRVIPITAIRTKASSPSVLVLIPALHRGLSARFDQRSQGRFQRGLDASRTTLGRALACNEARVDRDCVRFGLARTTTS